MVSHERHTHFRHVSCVLMCLDGAPTLTSVGAHVLVLITRFQQHQDTRHT